MGAVVQVRFLALHEQSKEESEAQRLGYGGLAIAGSVVVQATLLCMLFIVRERDVTMPDEPGCWVVFGWDDPYYVVSIHDNELEAYRVTMDHTCYAKFIKFGKDFLRQISGKE